MGDIRIIIVVVKVNKKIFAFRFIKNNENKFPAIILNVGYSFYYGNFSRPWFSLSTDFFVFIINVELALCKTIKG